MLMMLGLVFLQMQTGASGPPGPADADDARPCVSADANWGPRHQALMMLGPVFPQMQIGASGPPGPADADDARPCVFTDRS